METFSALLALCAGNSPVFGEYPSQKPVTRSFGVFLNMLLYKHVSEQSRCHRAHYNFIVMHKWDALTESDSALLAVCERNATVVGKFP